MIRRSLVGTLQLSVRVICHHENGTQIATDLPAALGGTGDQVTPGWLLRAGLASCLASRIVMQAAAERIALTKLEVLATSTSDARGILGMTSDRGGDLAAGPIEVRLTVRIGAPMSPGAGAKPDRREPPLLAGLGCPREHRPRHPPERDRSELIDALSETLRVVRLVGAIFISGSVHGTLVLPIAASGLRGTSP